MRAKGEVVMGNYYPKNEEEYKKMIKDFEEHAKKFFDHIEMKGELRETYERQLKEFYNYED